MTDHCCKIGATIAKYDLQESVLGGNTNEYLRASWVGENEFPETAIRPLCHWLNLKIMKGTYSKNNRKTIETYLESDYEALRSDDEVTKGEIIDDLKEDGIDGEQLIEDFVSSSTLYRHLTNCLGADKKKNNSKSDSHWEDNKIKYVQSTMQKNVEDVLRSLEKKGELPQGTEAKINTPIILGCPECSTQVRFKRAVSRGYICPDHMGPKDHFEDDIKNSEENKSDDLKQAQFP